MDLSVLPEISERDREGFLFAPAPAMEAVAMLLRLLREKSLLETSSDVWRTELSPPSFVIVIMHIK